MTEKTIKMNKETAISFLLTTALQGQKHGCLNLMDAGGPVLKAIRYFNKDEKEKPTFGTENDEGTAIEILIKTAHIIQRTPNNPLSFQDAGVLVESINFLSEYYKNTDNTDEVTASTIIDRKGKKPARPTRVNEHEDDDDDDIPTVKLSKKL